MPDTFLNPRVLELIASRICHDLVSPVGAISNGVELVQDLGDDAGEEAMQLIANSAQQASVRLKAFRLTYGAAGTDKNVGFKDVKDAFNDLLGASRIQAEFEQEISVKFSMPPRGFFKTLLNLLILAEECNRGDGKIVVASVAGNKAITVTSLSANAAFRDGVEDALNGVTEPDDLDARSIHAYVTGKFAQHFGLKLTYKAEQGRVEFTLGF